MSDAAVQLSASLSSTITDARVLAAIASVPRGRFVPTSLQARAYENVALPIGCEQTISQPIVVARMLELLELIGTERVLDVGTGSGYHAALLGRLASQVVSIERHRELSRQAGRVLADLDVANVTLFVGDGSTGLADLGPFDAVNIAAAIDGAVPASLLAQLAPGGRLVAPIADDPANPRSQWLVRIRSDGDRLLCERCDPVRFVPLVLGPPPPAPAAGA